MKKIFLVALSLLTLNGFAQWPGGGGGWPGGGDGGFNGNGASNQGNINSYKSEKDIDYVGDNATGHKMDIYFPKDDGNDKHPVLIHIYGSAWMMNNMKGSADQGTVGVAVLEAGYILVNPNHRSIDDAKWPAQINDIKALVRFLRGNAEKYGIDTSFIAVSGFSSGGHLASVMATSRNVKGVYTKGSASADIEGDLGRYTNESSWVDAACDWSGPVDCRNKACAGNGGGMAPEDNIVGGCNAQSCPDRHALLSATEYIDATDAPVFVAHGSQDNTVPQCEGKMFFDDLQRAGVEDCEYHPHGGGHGVEGSLTGDMVKFLNKIRAKKAAASVGVSISMSGDQYICYDGEVLKICNNEENQYDYFISDVSGKVIMTGVMTPEGINISSLNKGVYFLRTNGVSFKFIK